MLEPARGGHFQHRAGAGHVAAVVGVEAAEFEEDFGAGGIRAQAVAEEGLGVGQAVEPFAERSISGLAVEVSSLPADRDVIFIPPRLEIVVRGGIRRLANAAPTDFVASVDYERLLSDTSGQIEPTVQAPSGIQVVSRRPERLQYVIREK